MQQQVISPPTLTEQIRHADQLCVGSEISHPFIQRHHTTELQQDYRVNPSVDCDPTAYRLTLSLDLKRPTTVLSLVPSLNTLLFLIPNIKDQGAIAIDNTVGCNL